MGDGIGPKSMHPGAGTGKGLLDGMTRPSHIKGDRGVGSPPMTCPAAFPADMVIIATIVIEASAFSVRALRGETAAQVRRSAPVPPPLTNSRDSIHA